MSIYGYKGPGSSLELSIPNRYRETAVLGVSSAAHLILLFAVSKLLTILRLNCIKL